MRIEIAGLSCEHAKVLALLSIFVLPACADSTIHTQANIAGVDTLSVDAKQRLVFVGQRSDPYDPARVTCTEPMPDALVARAAVFAASANITNPGGVAASGGLASGSSESAASIGFRNETVQMLRDGYFRLCEAYMNGALSKPQYEHMILNADTFMVVISALQTLGSNPVAPAVAINAGGGLTASVPKDGSVTTAELKAPTGEVTKITTVPGTATAAKNDSAKMAAQIVNDYLKYRIALARYNDQKMARMRRAAPQN
jgi:hypothetical protein